MDEQAGAATAATVADPDEPERDDGPQDSTRLNWLEAQGQVQIYEWVAAEPGGASTYELEDVDGTTIGQGPDLRAAIDDAMGVRTRAAAAGR